MKFIALTKILFLCSLALTNQSLLHRVKQVTITDPQPITPTKSSNFSIKSITGLLKKFESFADTSFGQFTLGFLFELTRDFVESKAQTLCTDNPRWQMVECMVNGVEVTLEAHFQQLGVNPNLTVADTEAEVTTIQSHASPVFNDTECPTEDWSTYIKRNGRKIADSIKSAASRVTDAIKTSVDNWIPAIGRFFNRPSVQGAMRIGKCMTQIPAVRTQIASVMFSAIASLFQLQWLIPFKNLILNFREVLCIIDQGFTRLRDILKMSNLSPKLRWFEYGKATGEVMYRIHQIYTIKGSKKRRRLLK